MAMTRSFSNRVLGGVCGGLGAQMKLNPWWVRIVFVVLSVVTGGIFVAVYLLLWWLVPQESLVIRRKGGFPFIFALLLIVLVLGLWVARTQGATLYQNGADLTMPILAVALSGVFFLRQLGGRA